MSKVNDGEIAKKNCEKKGFHTFTGRIDYWRCSDCGFEIKKSPEIAEREKGK